MKFKKYFVSWTLVFSLFFMQENLFSVEELSDYEKGQLDGKARAKKYDSIGFFAMGCLLSWIGFGITLFIDPVVPTDEFIGKTDVYIEGYSKKYKEVVKSKNVASALIGSSINTGVLIVGGIIIAMMIVDTTEKLTSACLTAMLQQILSNMCSKKILSLIILIRP